MSRDVGGLRLVYELRLANRVLTFQISAWVEGNHVIVVNLFIILYFVVEFDGICTSTKVASQGFNGVTMSNRSINLLMRGSVCIFFCHSNSHISFYMVSQLG